MSNPKFYNRQQRDLFMKTFNIDPHKFTDKTMMLATNKWQFNMFKFDEYLSTLDSEYNNELCTYQGRKNYSMSAYIRTKYGHSVCELIEDLIHTNFDKTTYSEEKCDEE